MASVFAGDVEPEQPIDRRIAVSACVAMSIAIFCWLTWCSVPSLANGAALSERLPLAAAAPGPSPTLVASPGAVTLGPTESVSIAVTLTAPSAQLDQVVMTVYHNGSSRTSVPHPLPDHLDAGSGATAIVTVTGGSLGSIAGSVTAVTSYVMGGLPPTASVVTASVTIAERPAILPTLGTLTVPASPSSIDDRHPGTVVVRLADTSSVPILVKSLSPTSTDSVTVTIEKPFQPVRLEPGQSQDVGFTAKPAPSFREGSHVMSFRSEVATLDGSRFQVLDADQTVAVSVFGEAQITSAVGAVSFLFIPGLLILVAVKFLWEQLQPRRSLSWLGSKEPEFWVAVISISVLAIPLYYGITALFGPARNLVSSFDSSDILRLWVGSLAAGGLVWFACYRRWNRTRIQPGDDAPTVVRKLSGRTHPTFLLEGGTWADQAGTVFGVADRFADKAVLVPRISFHTADGAIGQGLDDALGKDDARTFWRTALSGNVTFAFPENRSVTQAPDARVTSLDQRTRILTAEIV